MRLCVVVMLCLLTACCVSVPNRYDASKPAAVRLQWAHGACSGVATGPYSVVTASHCTRAMGLTGSVKVNDVSTAYRVVADDGFDHVVLRVTVRMAQTARLVQRPLVNGETLYLWGNPDSLRNVLRIGQVGGSDPKSDLCIETVKVHPCPATYFTGTQVTHGDSGAPYFDPAGNVVAIESGGYTIPDYAFSIAFVYALHFTDAQLQLLRQ